MIIMKCIKCREQMDVPDSLAGEGIDCPACGNHCEVPTPTRSLPAGNALATQSAPATVINIQNNLGGDKKDRQGEPEQVLWTGRPSHMKNLIVYTVLGFIGLISLMFIWPIGLVVFAGAAALGVGSYIAVESTTYTLTTQRIRVKGGIMAHDSEEIELYRVTDSKVRQSHFQSLFAAGDILIVGHDARTPRLTLRWIVKPLPLREQIRLAYEDRRVVRGVREVETHTSLAR